MFLWGLERRRLDLCLSLLTLVLLGISRFALLASGPWEWDETIFARGMLEFELAAHFPHPPGFPGLLALGHVLLPLAGAPYEALQWLSALCSTLVLLPLSAIGRRVAPAPVATLAALFVLALPGPWLFAGRGFSTIPATLFLLLAAAEGLRGFGAQDEQDEKDVRPTLFTLMLTVAFLIRPIFLPTIALLWLFGAARVGAWRRLIPGLVSAAGMIGVAIAVMVYLEGGWAAFVEPFVRHAGSHASRLDWNTEVISDYGLVTGVGGIGIAVPLALMCLAGLSRWFRRLGWKVAFAWMLILGLTSAQLIMLQNRSYPRYAVVVHTAVAPLIAGAAALAPAPLSISVLVIAGGMAVWRSFPLVEEQHRETFAAWGATVDAAAIAAEREWAVVVEPEVYPFASYWWHVLEDRGSAVPTMVLSPRAPEPWPGVDRPWVLATVHPHLYWDALTGSSRSYGEVSPDLEVLTQGRFLTAIVSENPPLPVGQWWSRERVPGGRTIMWAGSAAELWIPPVPAGTRVGLELMPIAGPQALQVRLGREHKEIAGSSGPTWVWLTASGTGKAAIVEFERDQLPPPDNGDQRPLSVQLRDVALRVPGMAYGGEVASDQERGRLQLEIDGAFGEEVFAGQRRGVWLEPEARLRLQIAEPGQLRLEMSAPRPTPPDLGVEVTGGASQHVELGSSTMIVEVAIGDPAIRSGIVELALRARPFIPSEHHAGADDRRLGVVLHRLDFVPDTAAPQGWWTDPGDVLAEVAD